MGHINADQIYFKSSNFAAHGARARVAKFSFSKITGSFFSLQRTIAKMKISNNFLIFFSRPLKRPKRFLRRSKENILFSFSSFLTLKN